MLYTNPPLDTHTLVSHLIDDGLLVNDVAFAEDFLENVSYFRFNAYLRPFEEANGANRFKPNNTLVHDFKNLLIKYPNVDIAAMGFPHNWQDEPLWR